MVDGVMAADGRMAAAGVVMSMRAATVADGVAVTVVVADLLMAVGMVAAVVADMHSLIPVTVADTIAADGSSAIEFHSRNRVM